MSDIILFDCDGPLVNDNTWHFFSFANSVKGLRWSYADYCRTGKWQAVTQLATSLISSLYGEFMHSCHFPGYRPTSGAATVLVNVPVISRVVGTSRPAALDEQTRAFLLRHYPGGFLGYHFGLYDKAATLRGRYQLACLVDDNVHEVCLARQAGIRACLFPTRNFRHDNGVPTAALLDTESLVHDDMSDEEWEQVCAVAWEQIGDLIFRHCLAAS